MTENNRFWILNTLTEYSGIKDKDKLLTFNEVVDLLNELNDENQVLKKKNKQLSMDFMDFKMKLIEQLQIHYDYASEQRQKNICNPFIAKSYEIICCDVRELAEEMGVDLE